MALLFSPLLALTDPRYSTARNSFYHISSLLHHLIFARAKSQLTEG
jgi:hypothetical protein